MKPRMLAVVGLVIALLASQGYAQRPNLIVIMTDNHSPWTLGCYGNRDIRTPHIDRLAAEGILFERAYSCNAVCSPSRASFLTGLLPSQHGVHRYLGANEAQMGENAWSTIEEFRTLPQVLNEAGYVCGLSGKWHLGRNMEPQEGFSFWVTKPHGHTQEFYDQQVIEHGEVREEPMYQTDLWTRRGLQFIRENRERPFFLFLAYNGPYGLSRLLLNESRNRHAAYYADKELPSFPRGEVHPWLLQNRDFINNPVSMRRYAAEVSGVDDGVGEVMKTLKELGLDDNTLVVFMADQGLSGGHGGIWGMGDHTRPISLFDSTLHIPLIFRHPGRIPAGPRKDMLVSIYDLLPTLLEYLNLSQEMEAQPRSPGRAFSQVLRGGEMRDWDNTIYAEFENVRAIRTLRWKYIERFKEEPNELYDLAADPLERRNLYGATEHAEVQRDLAGKLHTFFDRYASPKYDLWNGGRSKTGLATAELFGLPRTVKQRPE